VQGPSRSAIEDAVSADLRQQLAALGASPLAQLAGESAELKALAADEHLRVKVSDQKCSVIAEDQFRCDVLLDLHGVGEQLPGAATGSVRDAGNRERLAVYVLTWLGGKWRAREERR
jgi:hypothetical protein